MSEVYVIEGKAENWEEALKMTGQELFRNGCVVEEFWEKCVEREKEYPTGLTEFCPVAIPHASKDYVLKHLTIATLSYTIRRKSPPSSDQTCKRSSTEEQQLLLLLAKMGLMPIALIHLRYHRLRVQVRVHVKM